MRHLLLLAACIATACAQPAPPPDLVPLLDAVSRAPALEAARKRIDAARARTASAGRLADPEVEGMASRVNADAMGENRDMWEVSLRQPLPKKGERAADRDRAAAAVSLAEADHALAFAELAADIAAALAEAEGAQARARLIAAQRQRLAFALQTLDTRLAAGVNVRLADRLTLQSRLAALELTVERLEREAADALAVARGRLALRPDAPLPPFAAPLASDIDPAASPLVAFAQARTAEANAMRRMAQASANPMTSVGLRFERERSSMGSQDIVGLAFSSELPFRSRNYARAELRAAEAERSAAQSEATAARHRISTTLTRVERAERLAATARRLAAETEKRLAAEHDILSRAVSVGTSTGGGMGGESAVLHAVEILEKSTESQLEIVEAETAAKSARAELWRHLPIHRLSP